MLTDIFIYSFQFTRCFSLEIMCISELLLEPNSPSEAHFKNRFNPKMPVKPPVAVTCFSASFDVATATLFWRAIKLNFEFLAELLLTSSLQCRTAELVPFYIHCIIVLHYFSFIKTNYSILQWVIQYGELKIIYLMMPWPTKNIFRFEQPRLLIKCKRFWNVLLEQKKIKKRRSFHRLPPSSSRTGENTFACWPESSEAKWCIEYWEANIRIQSPTLVSEASMNIEFPP